MVNRAYIARKSHQFFLLLLLLGVAGASVAVTAVTAQTTEQQRLREPPTIEGAPITNPAQRVEIAASTAEYRVTPGDVYRVTYTRSGETLPFEVTIDNDYIANLGLFGQVNAADLTISQLKSQIRDSVAQAIPRSLPSVSMVSAGVFQVRIVGQLAQSTSVTAWGMSRLSDVVRGHLEPYSSIRQVRIISATGDRSEHDLFLGIESGLRDHDPIIRTGDTVELLPAERVVYVGGAVNRERRLELRPGESFEELLSYVRGTTREADRTNVRVRRTSAPGREVLRIDIDGAAAGQFSLEDGDIVRIPTHDSSQQVIYIEGRSGSPSGLRPATLAEPEFRRIIPIEIGETLHDVLVQIWEDLPGNPDLAGGEIIRDGQRVSTEVPFDELLFSFRREHDIELQPLDRIVIPLQDSGPADAAGMDGMSPGQVDPSQPSVLVTGGVNNPGRYSVVPETGAFTHIRYAGGFNREVNSGERFRIYDSEGNVKSNEAFIEDGDHIEVFRNSFVYNFNRNFPIIATGVGFFATIVATLTLLGL